MKRALNSDCVNTMFDRPPVWAFVILALSLFSAHGSTQTVFVDANYGGCPGSGTPADPFCSIQTAIAAASSGGTVSVAPGTYFENIDFLGKDIVVVSQQGPEVTIIDGGNGVVATVTFQNNETSATRLEGFTVQNGRGGISCFQASPTIEDNIVTSNVFLSGVRCVSGSPVIRGNTISYNTGTIGNAGGIYCAASSAFISNNLIEHNTGRYGGGISCRSGTPTITTNRIIDNTATDVGGGGVFLRTSEALVINNEIVRNSATTGGGLYSWGLPSSTLINNTITENSATVLGGGLYSLDATTSVSNSIFWDNGVNAIRRVGGSISIAYSNIEGGYAGPGNLNSNPLFLDPGASDFRLSCGSPCVGSADQTVTVLLPDFDREGRDLRAIGALDIGADELGTLWSLNGSPVPGGAPIYFEAVSAPELAGDVTEVYVSLGEGKSFGGLPVPGSGGRRLFLDNDLLFAVWLGLPSPLRQVNLSGCTPAGTFPFTIPPNVVSGLKIYFASITWDLPSGAVASVPLPQTITIQ
ncbi:MAG: right-handed parallel beta-helix repeat-containing protein [Planctomycetota bacterium]